MNPELLHIVAQRHYQDLIGAAQSERRAERADSRRTSELGRTVRKMRFHRRRRALAIRSAAFGRA